MTAVQTIQIRLSECRQRLNTLLQIETRSAEQQTELETLTAEVSKREPELRAALASEPDPETTITDTGDPEQRERLEIRSKTGRAASPLGVQRRERRIERRGKWGGG